MNMLISRRAGRGERASPVLFLHSSDERGKERGMEKRGGGEKLGKCVLLLERKGNKWKGGKDEGQRRKTLEGESVEIHLWNPWRSTNKHCGNMDGGEPMLCYIVLETNESPMLRGRREARLEEVVRKTGRWEGKKGEIVVIVPSAFQLCFWKARQAGK